MGRFDVNDEYGIETMKKENEKLECHALLVILKLNAILEIAH